MTRRPEDPRIRPAVGRLGPCPECAVAALADLGLEDAEIGRYFQAPRSVIARLRGGAGRAPADACAQPCAAGLAARDAGAGRRATAR
ncbi:hypothetical protein SAMN05216258_107286 [Albimonas pacifica]|uniref:Uncharacterized protein n=2 Tax=Albimonas pacifica TaxID=1114924 RepID=A0A1I3IZ69_9RHOB|nr:hypothetical protein SAMN05216258_107286 [Albimonas pacifica]